MLSLRNINPMVRAVGTMGAVAALVGGVTFAQLTSNTVALTPNNLTTATATLAIGPGTSCTNETVTTTTPGLSGELAFSGTPVTTTFCLANTGDVAMNITASIPQDLSGSVAAQNTTLTVSCPGLGAALVGPLSGWGPAAFANALAAGATTNCTASASLSSSYTGGGGEAIQAFSVNFAGTEVTPV